MAEAYNATAAAQAATQAARTAQHEAEERARVAERALAVANDKATAAAESEASATQALAALTSDLATARASNDALAAQLTQVRSATPGGAAAPPLPHPLLRPLPATTITASHPFAFGHRNGATLRSYEHPRTLPHGGSPAPALRWVLQRRRWHNCRRRWSH